MKTNASSIYRPYNRILIYCNGVQTVFQISRLVLTCFVGEPPTASHVACHLNGKSDDDRLENLKWGLPFDVKTSQIIRSTWAHGHKSPRSLFAPEQIRAIKKILKAGISPSCLANAVGVTQSRIRCVAIGKTWNPAKHVGRENPLRTCFKNGLHARAWREGTNAKESGEESSSLRP